jgi:hypothetical protein
MSKNTFKWIVKVVAICLVILGIAIIYVFDPFIEGVQHYPSHLGLDRGYYKINPEIILTSLDNGETKVFTPETTSPENPIFDKYFSWGQSDYTRIIAALHEFVWDESLNDWRLYNMYFGTPCHDKLSGFELGKYYYFKTIFHKSGQIGYAGRGYLVTPQYGDVEWGSGPNYPHPVIGWKSVNINKVKITAEEALAIAEQNGGKEARLLVNNECNITTQLSGYSGWRIFIYRNDTGASIFRMEVDPSTGKAK